MMRRLVFSFIAVVLLAPTSLATDSEVPELTHNPIDRPSLVATVSRGSERSRSGSWPFILQATLKSETGSLANVDGKLLSVGEEYEGYQLIRVGEGTAIFRRDGVDIAVSVGKRNDDEDDT